jgi:hypothetical protein
MKRTAFLIYIILSVSYSLSAQKEELITVKAGMKVRDAFTLSEIYMYSEFIPGRIFFTNGKTADKELNYNYLAGEMEFIQQHDTLAIVNKNDIKYVVIAKDKFYYDKGYIEQLNSGMVMIGLKQYIELQEIQNKDSYGTASSGSATNSYGTLPVDGNFYKLVANKDMILKKTLQYYISTPESGFYMCNKKNILQMFPENEDKIKSYLKSNKVKYDSREDLLKLAEYLESL